MQFESRNPGCVFQAPSYKLPLQRTCCKCGQSGGFSSLHPNTVLRVHWPTECDAAIGRWETEPSSTGALEQAQWGCSSHCCSFQKWPA